MKYRKIPVEIEATKYLGEENIDEILAFAPLTFGLLRERLIIRTLEGPMEANIGDWIIKGVKGEYYPCKPDIFEMTYELVSAQPTIGAHD